MKSTRIEFETLSEEWEMECINCESDLHMRIINLLSNVDSFMYIYTSYFQASFRVNFEFNDDEVDGGGILQQHGKVYGNVNFMWEVQMKSFLSIEHENSLFCPIKVKGHRCLIYYGIKRFRKQ